MASQALYRTMREQITDQIRADVLSGQFPKGTQLREQALAERVGVSRGPVRDSLLQLTHEGLLVSKPNCGVVVGADMLKRIQPLVVRLRHEIEIFSLREVFAQKKDIVATLESTCEQLKAACQQGDMAAVVQQDMQFHRTIVTTGGGEDLVDVWLPIVVRMMLHYTRHKEWMDSYREHHTIVEAIRQGDKKAAIQALKTNIQ